MIKLDQPLHDVERALLATNAFMNRKLLLQYKPLKIALDKAKYFIQKAMFGPDVDHEELKAYPSPTAVRLSHPIILMENHKQQKQMEKILHDYGSQLYGERMDMVKAVNRMRALQGERALSVIWLPDMDSPLAIHTLSKEDMELAKVKEEPEDVPRNSQSHKLDTKLAKNRPLKKRPTTQVTDRPRKKAARMRATNQ